VRLITATVLVLVVTSCGSGGRLSHDAYVGKLNAECADFAARERKIGEPSTMPNIAVRGERIADAFDAAIRDPQRQLRPPARLDREAAELRKLADATSTNLHAIAGAARAGDRGRVEQLATENGSLNTRSNRLTTAIGACASHPG
jgi:hypothetical protein